MKYKVYDEKIKHFINSLTKEDKDKYEWIKENILKRIPDNPENDDCFHIMSSVENKAPIISYKKCFLITYRLDKTMRKVILLGIEYE